MEKEGGELILGWHGRASAEIDGEDGATGVGKRRPEAAEKSGGSKVMLWQI